MPQIFTASVDTRLRAALLLLAVAVGGGGLLLGGGMGSSFATRVGWVRHQPVPFSHEHHVGGLGIDCRYCHTSVEDGPQAGLPQRTIVVEIAGLFWHLIDIIWIFLFSILYLAR